MEIGGKAQSLQILVKAGFNVPKFFLWEEPSSGLLVAANSHLNGVQYFAVRSSAIGEDSSRQSFAGQFYSAIGVRSEDIVNAATKVVASYKGRKGSIIVQEFISSDSSGVMFTEVNYNRVVINSTIGLCSPVVNGEACDEYVCDKTGTIIKKTVQEKNTLFFGEGSFFRRKTKGESLSLENIKLLIQLGAKLQQLFRSPQDVEWAFKDGKLFVLQSRPITKVPIIAETEYYDSANIAESYSGIVLPLTFSFAQMVYSRVYKDLLHRSGVPYTKLEKYSNIFDNLLGCFYGRMYYNMNNWYRMAEFVPGYRRNKKNFESMITSNIREEIGNIIHPSVIMRLAYPIVVSFKVLTFGITSKLFRSNVIKELNLLRRNVFDKLSYDECVDLFREINGKLLRKWYITIENDFFVMTYLGFLKKMIGEKEIGSVVAFPSKATQQVDALYSLSKKIKGSNVLYKAVQSGDVKTFDKEIINNNGIQTDLYEYMDNFGGRFANELKLESMGIDEDRSKLLSVLKLYSEYESRVGSTKQFNPPLIVSGFKKKFVLSKFRKYASRREEFRLLRSNTFAMARKLFRRMGYILHTEHSLDSEDDIFYLTLDEILNKDKFVYNYRDIIAKRKEEYKLYKDIILPTHFSTSNRQPPKVERPGSQNLRNIFGQPTSSGKVTGRVRVFHDFFMPKQIDFDILVTSHTDPGWTPLIALSKGLIIEHGGILSHASIVARELGIPTITGVRNVMSLLHDGDIVEINGETGIINIQ